MEKGARNLAGFTICVDKVEIPPKVGKSDQTASG